jgi:molybdopterin-guanine dinucleotide biosynthesis protein A
VQRRYTEITGFVLAGGDSKRMGRSKAHLLIGHETMTERQILLLCSLCRSVAVLGPPEQFRSIGVPVFADRLPGRGPLAALYTGLLLTHTEYNLFLSCDLPFMRVRFLRYLCGRALGSCADVTVPESREHAFHPLCAVYRRRALWAIRTSLLAGQGKVSSFFRRVRRQVLTTGEIARAGFGSKLFHNMNTVEDYEAVKKWLVSARFLSLRTG